MVVQLELQGLHAIVVVHKSLHCNVCLARKPFKFDYLKKKRKHWIDTAKKLAGLKPMYLESLFVDCPPNCLPSSSIGWVFWLH